MTIKTIAVAIACLSAGIIFASDVKVGENDITINGAKVTWTQGGDIRVTKNGQKCLTISFIKFYMHGKNVSWQSVDHKNNIAKKNGNVFTWDLKRTFDGKTYAAGEQTLEVLADGKLKYSLKYNTIDAPGWTPRSKGAMTFINLPYALFDDTTLNFNGKDYKLAQDMKGVNSGNPAQITYVFNSEKTGKITISANKADVNGGGVSPDKVSKVFRTTFNTNSEGTLAVTIDLTK